MKTAADDMMFARYDEVEDLGKKLVHKRHVTVVVPPHGARCSQEDITTNAGPDANTASQTVSAYKVDLSIGRISYCCRRSSCVGAS